MTLPANAHSVPPALPPALPLVLPRSLGDLAPAGARLAFRVRAHLDELGLDASQRLVTGFSGGADSTALAVLLHCLGYAQILVHLDHGLRTESAVEALHVAAMADALGVPFIGRAENVSALAAHNGQGLEEAGREVRYALFEDVRAARGFDWVTTGHHLDDLCEDMLLRLVRGTGWPGLGGMAALDAGRHLVRPLLPVRRAELEAFLLAHRIPWLTDASNADPIYRRNRLRHTVMPLLLAENPRFPEAMLELNHMARLDEAHWKRELAAVLACVREEPDGLSLPRTALAQLSPAARQRVLMALVRRMPKGQARAASLRRAVKALGDDARKGTGKRFQLPGGGEIRLERERVLVRGAKTASR